MKASLVVFALLTTTTAFSKDILILKTSAWGRCGNDSIVFSEGNGTKEAAEDECRQFGGTVTSTRCQEQGAHGNQTFVVAYANSCAVICTF